MGFMLVLLVMIPVFGFAFIRIIGMMIQNELDTGHGLIAMSCLLVAMVAPLVTQNFTFGIVVSVSVFVLIVLFPFAENQLIAHELRHHNSGEIDRLHNVLQHQPDNIPALFALSKAIYVHGYRGHAIYVAEQTVAKISRDPDPFTNRAPIDIYRQEIYELGRWKQAVNQSDFKPIACPFCSHANPPAGLLCSKCNKPYLLEAARGGTSKSQVYGKIVLTFALMALMVPVAGFTALGIQPQFRMIIILGAIAIVGGTLFWLFRSGKNTAAVTNRWD